ncbi:hypothetical protein N4G41_02430 [Kosakonia sacchari]|uniref:hypothetical protein n=1 Tax=Kosakonia sacchari TaxID=1158459 RepID=UPI002ACE3EB7|nr:hypothetical protein [Kosakonia sacchari]MDZ7320483.1 hypothetical protein [Kosakonia sacchari]
MEAVLVIALVGGFVLYIGRQCYLAYQTDQHGRLLNAKILSMRSTGSNDGGSTNVVYELAVDFDGVERIVKGSQTIDTFYSSQLEPGKEIQIKYLDDENILFQYRK